jgi:hypothetical protein
MDFLKWIFTTSMAVALLFFGLQPESEKDEANNQNKSGTTIHFLLK